MENILKYAGVVALIIAIATFFVPHGGSTLVGNTTQDFWDTAEGYKVDGTTVIDGSGRMTLGTSGTQVTGFNFGTCYILAYATTIAASSSATVECQGSTNGTPSTLAGIANGDSVAMSFPTSTPATLGGLRILGASASTTSGYITMTVWNGTGGTFTWTSAASTTSYRAWR